jgi:hypothetical protein
MSVDNSNTIDIASLDREANVVCLTVSDHLPWAASLDHQFILQEKLNAYLRFIESGELIEKFPDYEGLPVLIDVRFLHAPDEAALLFLGKAQTAIEKAGFSFSYGTGTSRKLLDA